MNSILITGCNCGLGLGLVKALLNLPKPPTHVFATTRNIDKSEELLSIAAKNPNVHIIQVDLLHLNEFDRIANEIEEVVKGQGLNVLFNNAGVAPKSTRLSLTKAEDLINSFQTNTVAPIMLTKSLLPLLKRAAKNDASGLFGVQRAAVINMSSILGSIQSNVEGGLYSYRAAKCGLNAATKSMSIDLYSDKILCVSMHPGWVQTDMGGSKAHINVETSCTKMVETLFNLNESNNGGFVQYDGVVLPW